VIIVAAIPLFARLNTVFPLPEYDLGLVMSIYITNP
jgi:hypothetical protein